MNEYLSYVADNWFYFFLGIVITLFIFRDNISNYFRKLKTKKKVKDEKPKFYDSELEDNSTFQLDKGTFDQLEVVSFETQKTQTEKILENIKTKKEELNRKKIEIEEDYIIEMNKLDLSMNTLKIKYQTYKQQLEMITTVLENQERMKEQLKE